MNDPPFSIKIFPMQKHLFFWEQNPALLTALSLLIGTSSALFWPFPFSGIWPSLWCLYLLVLRKWTGPLFLLGALLYGHFLIPQVEEGNVAYFSPSSLKPHQSPFTKGLLYQGTLTMKNSRPIPCCVLHPLTKDYPKADCAYILKGKLKKRGDASYFFQAKEWIPVEKTWRFAELRFQMKERLRQFLDQKFEGPRVATFLSSLLTGDVEDRSLRYEFGKLGLQHILAISGFHFAILIAFSSFFLNLFLPHKWKILFLLFAINAYFLFVGNIPAVQRSYLSALFFLIGKLGNRLSSSLNLLGSALLIEVLLNPYVSPNLGFQLSFLSCAGLLLLRPLFLPLTTRIFPKYDPSSLTLFAKHGYLLTSFLREALAITLAVNTALLPILLFYFHTFPLLSLLYNLFFPFLVGIALFLLLLSLLTHFLFPLLSIPLFSLTDFFTKQLLDLTAYPPLFLDYSIHLQSIPAWVIPPYLFALFCISLFDEYPSNSLPFRFFGDRSSGG